ncbi:hypothetical protein PVOR_01515 [Paenibacillus vortex V453]|uniref:Uncharacterized protein n=1 Tax=Paenibacillus vortex V453 TaxID=715225 RepID=A0A2R9T2H2_9BACL|nr:hypothetical protein [Paenibacillus vortex]EFU43848.1 hypothetical protein PVOR_01515 [Paenibacillus vortex V453]
MGVVANLVVYMISSGLLIFMVILVIRKIGGNEAQRLMGDNHTSRRLRDQQQQLDPYMNPGVDVVVDRYHHGMNQHHIGSHDNNG